MKQRLQGLERKILVGGENLLEKAEEQERLLEESAKELEERRRHEEQLRHAITQKEVRRRLRVRECAYVMLAYMHTFVALGEEGAKDKF